MQCLLHSAAAAAAAASDLCFEGITSRSCWMAATAYPKTREALLLLLLLLLLPPPLPLPPTVTLGQR
jgi:hypothetical protein